MPDKFHLIFTPAVRAWIYRVCVALVPLLMVAGIVTDETAPLILGLAAAVLSTGTAAAHTPTKP